jgi:hypothetical protein
MARRHAERTGYEFETESWWGRRGPFVRGGLPMSLVMLATQPERKEEGDTP